MRSKNRFGTFLVLAAAAMFAVGACGNSTATGSPASAAAPPASAAASPASAAASSAPAASSPATTSNEEYVWISQNSTLPLFVARDHPTLMLAGKELGVKVRIAGPTNIDLAAFISTIETECAAHPAGVIVVGWDPSLSASVDKCIAEKVPTVTDDADLPNSKRLSFIGTDWYQIGVQQALVQIADLKARGLTTGKVATLSIINADNMKAARLGFSDTLKGSAITIVTDEDDGGASDQAASKTAALVAAYPDLTGFAGFDSESGAGIVTALDEANKAGKFTVTAMEQSPEFFKTVKDGKVTGIVIQKRELFTYYAVKMLYDFNHNSFTIAGLDKWTTSTIPRFLDTGLVMVTKANVDQVLAAQK